MTRTVTVGGVMGVRGQVREQKIGRILLADVLPTALAAVVFLVGSSKAAQEQVPPSRPMDALAYTLLALAAAAMPLRRHAPLIMLAVESVLVGGYLAAGYAHGPIFLALVVASFAVGSRSESNGSVPVVGAAAVAAVLGVTVSYARGHSAGAWDYVGSLFICLAATVVPALIATLRRNWRQSEAWAEEEATRRRIEQERLRMAREVHDVVGHSLSIISLQAAVALHVLDRRPQQAQVALEAIRRTSVDALDELRATLALTRAGRGAAATEPDPDPSTDPSPPVAPAPAPDGDPLHQDLGRRTSDGRGSDGEAPAARVPLTGLGRLPGLLAEVRLCGVPVGLETRGALDTLPADIDLAAYRVVQESLTNVLRHAGPTRVKVTLCLDTSRLTIEVTDEPRTDLGSAVPGEPAGGAAPDRPAGDADPGRDAGSWGGDAGPDGDAGLDAPAGQRSGHGLAGLQERAAELGGQLTAGPRPSGGWQVSAVLPVRATGPSDLLREEAPGRIRT
jgi:signal transduction histidine kinase